MADVVSTSGPNTINRENVQRKTVVSVNVAGRDQKSTVDEIQKMIAEKSHYQKATALNTVVSLKLKRKLQKRYWQLRYYRYW